MVPINDKIKNHYINNYGFKLRGYDKSLKKNIYYKLLNYNINNILKLNKTPTKYKTHTKRHTLKIKKHINNINDFIEASKPKKIINLENT